MTQEITLVAFVIFLFSPFCASSEYVVRGVNRYNRTAPSSLSASSTCQYKELMMQMNDRLGLLTTLDESQRAKLDSLTQKLIQFESSNLARLESINTRQMDSNQRLEAMELTQKHIKVTIDELKGEFDSLVERSRAMKPNNAEEMRLFERQPRQTSGSSSHQEDTATKLDNLSMLLTSARFALNELEQQIVGNFTRLFQITRDLQKRINALPTRRQMLGSRESQHSISPQTSYYAGDNSLPSSCSQIFTTENAVHKIQVNPTIPSFYVACDQSSAGGGWTVIQNRIDGTINFNRDWIEYKTGFGNLAGEFFIGLDKLHAMTSSQLHELMIVMEDFSNNTRYARYKLFAIANEHELYALQLLGEYEGDAGDSLTYSASHKFSTFDSDNDGWLEGNCAQAHTGAWWYNACEQANLNGQYLGADEDKNQLFQGMYWYDFNGPSSSLKSARMMIRPLDSATNRRR